MSNEPHPRNPNRVGRTGSATGSTAAIVIAVVAVLLGLLILKKMSSNDSSDSSPSQTRPTTDVVDSTDPPVSEVSTTTTEPPAVKTGSKVQVANASNQNKVAGKLSTVLGSEGFEMGTPVNANEKRDVTSVLYTDGDTTAEAVARTLAKVLGGAEVGPLSPPIPIDTGRLDEGVGVLVMLGRDKAGKTLAEMQAAATPTPESSAPSSGDAATSNTGDTTTD